MLDTNDLFFNGTIKTTSIEPNPKRLFSIMRPGDAANLNIIKKNLQDIDIELFYFN